MRQGICRDIKSFSGVIIIMTEKQNEKQNIAIAELKVKMENLEKRFEDFITNDFEHLRQDIQNLYSKINSLTDKIVFGFIAMIASTLILQVVLRFFK